MNTSTISKQNYRQFFETFSSLLEQQCLLRDEYQTNNDTRSLIEAIPYMISLTNSISCLRGQLSTYRDAREIDGEDQKYFYERETYFEKKLSSYIETIRASDDYDRYIHHLTQFFVQFRK